MRHYRYLADKRSRETGVVSSELATFYGLLLAFFVALSAIHHALAETEPTPSATEVNEYGYRVVSQARFDRENFTQGLEFYRGRLYVSSGLYGQSVIRVYDFPEMSLIRSVPIDSRIFVMNCGQLELRHQFYQFSLLVWLFPFLYQKQY